MVQQVQQFEGTFGERGVAVPELDDEALAIRARTDPDAFAELFQRYVSPIYWYCYGKSGEHAVADDATGAVFEKLLHSLQRYDPARGEFRPWMFHLAHNVVVDDFRGRQRRSAESLESVDPGPDSQPGIEESYLRTEQLDELLAALKNLPDGDREVIELRLAGLDTAEIAAALNRTRGAVDSAQYRAVSRLQTLLGVDSERGASL